MDLLDRTARELSDPNSVQPAAETAATETDADTAAGSRPCVGGDAGRSARAGHCAATVTRRSGRACADRRGAAPGGHGSRRGAPEIVRVKLTGLAVDRAHHRDPRLPGRRRRHRRLRLRRRARLGLQGRRGEELLPGAAARAEAAGAPRHPGLIALPERHSCPPRPRAAAIVALDTNRAHGKHRRDESLSRLFRRAQARG